MTPKKTAKKKTAVKKQAVKKAAPVKQGQGAELADPFERKRIQESFDLEQKRDQFPVLRRAEIGTNYLRLPDDATAEDVRETYNALKRIGSSYHWWLGDFIVESLRLKTAEMKDAEEGERDKVLRDHMEAIIEGFGVHDEVARRCYFVCRVMEQSLRRDCSTFTHHRVALEETQDVSEAVRWVTMAAEEGMSVAAMRLAIRQAHRLIKHPLPAGTRKRLAPIYKAITTVNQINISDLSQSDRATIKQDLKPLLDWYSLL